MRNSDDLQRLTPKTAPKEVGQTIGNGKYILSKNPPQSTSGKSQVYGAYRCDSNGNPEGNQLAIKMSRDCEAIIREAENYDRITNGPFPGRFVKKIDYLPEINAQPASKSFSKQCALVTEFGQETLNAVVTRRGGQGLDGPALRNAAEVAAQCLQSMHSSGVVWTDLKAENLVVIGEDGDSVLRFKGIDVANAMPNQSNPVSYNPSISPPELARVNPSGSVAGLKKFTLDCSFDIWSYGILLYELGTGRQYFSGMIPKQITKALTSKDFAADVSDIKDSDLKDLIEKCLKINPEERPNIEQVLQHPYLLPDASDITSKAPSVQGERKRPK
jgi:serine/threonine protein kinase